MCIIKAVYKDKEIKYKKILIQQESKTNIYIYMDSSIIYK